MTVWRPVPDEVHTLVERTPASVLLECGKPDGGESLLFLNPMRIVAVRDPAGLSEIFAQIDSAIAARHYAAGYFAYECGGCFEPAAKVNAGDGLLAWIGIYEHCYRFDHHTGRFADHEPPQLSFVQTHGEPAEKLAIQAELPIAESEYGERIAAIHELIRAGDVYQLNFTVPLKISVEASPGKLYRELRRRQAVEYGAMLHCEPGRHILSFSPELFFRIDAEGETRRITTRPMKGTVARGRTTTEDRVQGEWLRSDAKNRAENVMIVDLLRNDLGQICEFGSVRVEDLFAIERLETLWQMTSTVTGTLRADVGFRDIFRALFPSGSITGAPKVRAMQLLAELEGRARGAYTGAIGYFSAEKTVFNVAIRTLEMIGGKGTMGVGSGIVIDSVAEDEFRECKLKAAFLTQARERAPDNFALIEAMLWNGNYPLLEMHLDRVCDSAEYLGFVCDRAEIREKLLAHAAGFENQAQRKVRMLLYRDGSVKIDVESIAMTAGSTAALQVCIARTRVDSADRMLFHKTTHRPVHLEVLGKAHAAGFADAILLNERGEVTESAIHNIFVEKGGQWFTPPIACGLLAGVYRRHLLETRPEIDERVLTMDDLRGADAIYLPNAVRGLRRAQIDCGTSV